MNRYTRKVVIAGGSGLVGRELAQELHDHDWHVTILSRSGNRVPGAHRSVKWMGESNDWKQELEGAYAVVNLAGESIQRRWDEAGRKAILNSRLESVQALGAAISECKNPPVVWLQMSAVGYYGNSRANFMQPETGKPGTDFLASVCEQWETAARSYESKVDRLVIARLGPVFHPEQGFFAEQRKIASRGMGGVIGKGDMWISWIHFSDAIRGLRHMIESELSGPFNLCAPVPVRQGEFSREINGLLGKLFVPPAPEFAVKILAPLMGVDADLALASVAADSQRLAESGFTFQFPVLREALADLFSSK